MSAETESSFAIILKKTLVTSGNQCSTQKQWLDKSNNNSWIKCRINCAINQNPVLWLIEELQLAKTFIQSLRDKSASKAKPNNW